MRIIQTEIHDTLTSILRYRPNEDIDRQINDYKIKSWDNIYYSVIPLYDTVFMSIFRQIRKL